MWQSKLGTWSQRAMSKGAFSKAIISIKLSLTHSEDLEKDLSTLQILGVCFSLLLLALTEVMGNCKHFVSERFSSADPSRTMNVVQALLWAFIHPPLLSWPKSSAALTSAETRPLGLPERELKTNRELSVHLAMAFLKRTCGTFFWKAPIDFSGCRFHVLNHSSLSSSQVGSSLYSSSLPQHPKTRVSSEDGWAGFLDVSWDRFCPVKVRYLRLRLRKIGYGVSVKVASLW